MTDAAITPVLTDRPLFIAWKRLHSLIKDKNWARSKKKVAAVLQARFDIVMTPPADVYDVLYQLSLAREAMKCVHDMEAGALDYEALRGMGAETYRSITNAIAYLERTTGATIDITDTGEKPNDRH